ncbi:hypothetical protein KGF57_001788 [Candida theae]|uniref:Mitochondrial 15S rRNA processing factor CCM1 n=1 Tax=Candida theae TaxID=1198502 RepID=A0AAD5FZC9_9ASCO|nr:uncharacterized protein KGF57_001788 [Candida theae]KAI5961275.1 hypothetical protein KGF57_001788 [Candida theae]
MLRSTSLSSNHAAKRTTAQPFKYLLGTKCHLFIPRVSPKSLQKLPLDIKEDEIEHQIRTKRLLQKQKYLDNDALSIKKLARKELSTLRELTKEVAQPSFDVDSGKSTLESAEQVYEAIHDPSALHSDSISSEQPGICSFPSEINERLGLVSNYLMSPTDAAQFKPQWSLLLHQLKLSGGFNGLDATTVQAFVKTIPFPVLKSLIPRIIEMYKEAGVTITTKVEFLIFKALATGGKVTPSEVQMMETYFEKLLEKNDQKTDYYETMVCAYVKSDNMKKVEKLLSAMKLKNIEITRSIFTSILQGYVYYVNDHDKAWETFNAMKFLSKKTQPNERNYTDMIFSFVKNNKLESALDMYQEMLDNRIPLNQNILATLARGCCKSKRFAIKSWDFIFKIYDHGWFPNLQTYESMLNLSAFEGTLDLTRALFLKMTETNSVTPKAVLYLMMSYSKHSFEKSSKRASIDHDERGRLFKQKVMQDIVFAQQSNGFPFLPLLALPNNDAALAEATAIISYIKKSNPRLLTPQLVTTFLNTWTNLGTMEGFSKHYEDLTCFEPLRKSDMKSGTVTEFNKTDIGNDKIARDTPIYIAALKAAAKFKNYELAKEILEERGQFRRSKAYQSMSKRAQSSWDFEFARALVECFKNMNMLKDALSVVLSSEERFPWSWKELGGLAGAALSIEDLQMVDEIKRVIKSNRNRR